MPQLDALRLQIAAGCTNALTVEAKVEVNDVPLGVAEPGLDSGDAVRGVGAVFGALAVLLHWPNNIGLALEHLLHEGGVADGDGIPE